MGFYKTTAPSWAVAWYNAGYTDSYSDMEFLANDYDLYISDLKELRYWLGYIDAEYAMQYWESLFPF